MSYADTHGRALALLARKGAAVTFTRTNQGSYNPETDAATITTTTVAGSAVRVKSSASDRERYAGLGLTESSAPLLVFAPTTYGETPSVGDTLTWSSAGYTVRDVEHIAPDGTVIAVKVIIAR